ncbi:hypothetical protein EV655_11011 [Rhodovulum euryhalinum]|uniref:Uncharacterized protein n=1 Tax=Rhodovulum euryhalinum TaxID=35805 RepID=A0A4R2KDM0_9RHOB|nr:hypothetical protein EV655_11011 [Rhodovulum euryhalinum]
MSLASARSLRDRLAAPHDIRPSRQTWREISGESGGLIILPPLTPEQRADLRRRAKLWKPKEKEGR